MIASTTTITTYKPNGVDIFFLGGAGAMQYCIINVNIGQSFFISSIIFIYLYLYIISNKLNKPLRNFDLTLYFAKKISILILTEIT